MASLKIIGVLILCLVRCLPVFAVSGDRPADLMCCPPGSGTIAGSEEDDNDNFCWNAETNKTTPLPLKCHATVLTSSGTLNLSITDTGQMILYLQNRPDVEVPRGAVCFVKENVTNDDGSIETLDLTVWCIDEEENSPLKRTLDYLMVVSVIFLVFTAILYAALPELRDLQGKSIVNFCASLAIGLAVLSHLRLTSFSDMIFCSIRGFMIYFFLIAAFFWTNAISVQILLGLKRPVVNNYGWKEFWWYALYAWGCPAVLTVCMAIVNYYPGEHAKPGIGLNNCWFFTTTEQWQYMYSVMTILIVCNICIFIYTSINLWRLSLSSSHVKALRYKLVMSLRMFIIMGLPWIFEMISTLTEKSFVWFLLDAFNMLQGPLIFLVLVVFRKRVIKALLKRGFLDCVAGPIEKYLAVRDDDEEGVMQHTVELTMDERNGI